MNTVQLLGNLGRDPETRTFQNGGKVVNLRVATEESWKKDGEWQSRTEWHSVAVFAERAGRLAEGLRKGDRVFLSGQLETRKWQDQSGNDRYSTEIVVRPKPGHMVEQITVAQRSPSYDQSLNAPAPSRSLDDEIPF